MKQSKTDIDEKELFNMFQEIDIEPSDELKEKSFQKALKGIEIARKKERRKRFAAKWQVALSLTSALAVAIVLIVPLLFNTDKEQNYTTLNEPDRNAQPPSENIDENIEKVDRPIEKELTISLEGMEEQELYQLVNIEELPFTTYIPKSWYAESIGDYDRTGVRLVPVNEQYGKIDIVFFPKETSLTDVKDYILEQELSQLNYQTLSEEQEKDRNVPEWSELTYLYQDEQQTKTGEIYIGEYKGTYFYIQSEFLNESLEGWGARKDIILEQWEWKDSQNGISSSK